MCGGVIHSVAKENCITATAFEPKSRLAEDMAPATTAVRDGSVSRLITPRNPQYFNTVENKNITLECNAIHFPCAFRIKLRGRAVKTSSIVIYGEYV